MNIKVFDLALTTPCA